MKTSKIILLLSSAFIIGCSTDNEMESAITNKATKKETMTLESKRAINSSFKKFLLQTGTALHETYDNFEFVLGDYNNDHEPDLFAIKKSRTGTKSTEIHVLNGANKFKSFLLHTGTALHETSSNFEFLLGDYNNDRKPDLYAIKKSRTGTKSTEIHILNGADNFQSFLLQTGTALHETSSNFEFALGHYNNDYKPDLYAIKKNRTGTKSTEIHVLNGANNFKSFLLQTGTALHETSSNFEFVVGYYNYDRKPDLYAIKKNRTGTKSTEIHILNGANNFQSFLKQTGTVLHETSSNFKFLLGLYNSGARPDIYAIKKNRTGSKSTEVHVFGQ